MAEGGAGAEDEEGGADIVVDDFPGSSERVRDSSRRFSDEVPLGEGVDAAVSATDAGVSVMFTSRIIDVAVVEPEPWCLSARKSSG